MACNCNKSTPPAGASPPPTGAHNPDIPPASSAPAGTSTPVRAPQSYVLTTHDGHTQTFGSQLEANAEKVRRGGGSVRPVR